MISYMPKRVPKTGEPTIAQYEKVIVTWIITTWVNRNMAWLTKQTG